MIKKFYADFKRLKENKRFDPVFDTFLFVIITFAIHYIYRYWEYKLNHRIFGFQVITPEFIDRFTAMVFVQTKVLVDLILKNETVDQTFFFVNQCSVRIISGCSGIQQMMQLAILILVYPGPWKHKLWFIPLGMLVVHLTNLIRLTGLCVVMANWPEHWHFAHDYPFRVIFYVVIFFLWVIWNDRFYHKKLLTKEKIQLKRDES